MLPPRYVVFAQTAVTPAERASFRINSFTIFLNVQQKRIVFCKSNFTDLQLHSITKNPDFPLKIINKFTIFMQNFPLQKRIHFCILATH